MNDFEEYIRQGEPEKTEREFGKFMLSVRVIPAQRQCLQSNICVLSDLT